MIINPKEILDREIVIAAEGCPDIDVDEQLQQAGIDVRINRIFTAHTSIIKIGKKLKPDFNSIYSEAMADCVGFIRLQKGFAYSVDSMEDCKIPEDMAALVLHRSTFNRSGVFITGSVYDPGFEGNIAATMYVHNTIEVEVGTRFAQIVFVKASAASLYKGTYQNQKSHSGK